MECYNCGEEANRPLTIHNSELVDSKFYPNELEVDFDVNFPRNGEDCITIILCGDCYQQI